MDGEAAGALAAFSLPRQVSPRAVRATLRLLDFQQTLDGLGIQRSWPAEVQIQVG